ncbi:TSUP family transporter [Lysobacter sp. A3-1-A15]|uniref:TSUP family transporter n=1 Tax=Novilysobacter viscosus TaxID=3098602 RepID=UPI002ED9C71C
MMWLAWLGAAAIGLSLGLLGSGGSILTVPVLVYLVGQPEKLAIAGSLAIVGGISLIAALPWTWKRQVDWRNVAWFGVPGMVGTWLGAWLSIWLSGALQLLLFAVVMLLAAVMMLRPPKALTVDAGVDSALDGPAAPARKVGRIALDGLVVGVVTGLVGVGGGFLIVPALVLLGGLALHRAIGTSLWIISLKSFSGFAKYTSVLAGAGLALDWRLIGLFTAIGAGGSLLGGRLARRLPQAQLQRGFAVFLLLMGAGIAWQTAPAALAATPSPDRSAEITNMHSIDQLVPQARHPGPTLVAGGQPAPQAWDALRAQGITTVVNLRPEAEMDGRDERGEVDAAGLDYHQIPVDGASGVTTANADALWSVLEDAEGAVLVHCASGNRVGALLALGAARNGGRTPEDALAWGQSAGLTGLGPKVRQMLGLPQAQ